jgi:hypothetical protein
MLEQIEAIIGNVLEINQIVDTHIFIIVMIIIILLNVKLLNILEIRKKNYNLYKNR